MNNNTGLFKVLDEDIYFENSMESQEYAKNNPGIIVTRNTDLSNDTEETISIEKKVMLSNTPQSILDYLNQHVISQEEAKKEISLAMYYHSLKAKYNLDTNTHGPLMLVGPTGSGKTFIVQKTCEYIDIIFVHVDASSMVPEGIKGYSISNLADEILEKSNYNIYKASHCVVFFDEVDKLFQGSDASEYGPKVASQLLRLVEGTNIKLADGVLEKIFKEHKIDELDTSNMQFIFGGAFQWIIDENAKEKSSMGFCQEENNNNLSYMITLEDLYNEGIPKELIGRMSAIVNLKELEIEDYFRLLKESKSSPLKDYIKQIEFHGDNVKITDKTLLEVSKLAKVKGLGVRGIKQVLKKIFNDALFNAASGHVQIHEIIFK